MLNRIRLMLRKLPIAWIHVSSLPSCFISVCHQYYTVAYTAVSSLPSSLSAVYILRYCVDPSPPTSKMNGPCSAPNPSECLSGKKSVNLNQNNNNNSREIHLNLSSACKLSGCLFRPEHMFCFCWLEGTVITDRISTHDNFYDNQKHS